MAGKRMITKGRMARRLVYYCVGMLTATALWAMILKTVDHTVELSDILTFVGAAFGGELLLLLVKRVCAKDKTTNEMEGETWSD